MEKFQEARAKAEKSLKIADHMLYVTYPLVRDDKLLVAILENIFLAFTSSMASVLYYERLFKRVPPFHDTFESKYNLFVDKIVPSYKLDKRYMEIITRIRDMVSEHKESPVEFARGGQFVICSKDYRVRTLSIEQLKQFIEEAKDFLKINWRIIEKNAYIFK
jgi:hypothetical protein